MELFPLSPHKGTLPSATLSPAGESLILSLSEEKRIMGTINSQLCQKGFKIAQAVRFTGIVLHGVAVGNFLYN